MRKGGDVCHEARQRECGGDEECGREKRKECQTLWAYVWTDCLLLIFFMSACQQCSLPYLPPSDVQLRLHCSRTPSLFDRGLEQRQSTDPSLPSTVLHPWSFCKGLRATFVYLSLCLLLIFLRSFCSRSTGLIIRSLRQTSRESTPQKKNEALLRSCSIVRMAGLPQSRTA